MKIKDKEKAAGIFSS